MNLEMCCMCGEPTDKAGRADGSIYRVTNGRVGTEPGNWWEEGEEIGPLCELCNKALDQLHMVLRDIT